MHTEFTNQFPERLKVGSARPIAPLWVNPVTGNPPRILKREALLHLGKRNLESFHVGFGAYFVKLRKLLDIYLNKSRFSQWNHRLALVNLCLKGRNDALPEIF